MLSETDFVFLGTIREPLILQESLFYKKIPNSVLIKIFENLDVQTLLELSLTCKRFYELIIKSSRLYSKFRLTIDYGRIHDLSPLLKVRDTLTFKKNRRKFERVTVIKMFDDDFKHFSMLIQSFAEHIKWIQFKDCLMFTVNPMEIFHGLKALNQSEKAPSKNLKSANIKKY